MLIRTEAIGLNYVNVQLRRETDENSIWYRQLPGTLTGDVVGTVERPARTPTRRWPGPGWRCCWRTPAPTMWLADTGWLARGAGRLDAAAASMLPLVGAVALGALRAGRLARGTPC